MSAAGVDLSGRRALITGAANGIGAACARGLAAAGAQVTIADVDGIAAKQVAADLDGEVWTVDLTDTTELDDLTLDVDILVNNAGIQSVAPIEEMAPDTFRRMHRLMVEAPFLLMRAALPAMYRNGFGRIVNISSVHGLRASAYKSAYVSAKHALEGLSKVAALEGAVHGVTSNCVNPGYVHTDLVDRQIADQARVHHMSETEVVENVLLAESAIKTMTTPDMVASLVVWLASDNAAMVTGASYPMDGGWSAS
ncbi:MULTISPECIES: 3-hydroxybutyrate dehydrogenase [unclassified Gordonia (in: high G+C Gram-positive bacteria)]|uniref:3-hydroxybutyrate dehydrogenase n=1 Tax=unclassified Gordonia (in: high G+C Gram-positive bacteria) TaxID=2657482 RepID=UPI0009ADEA24|nr:MULTISPECIES: 3-hydroxybutyrate dehydrogenase [unclassified Gordonia (in: high G+C Gram-positive bacteria)]MDF3281063.1 3-hydroxybutyrate dehydrogenase [Gordonia sp. N1V]OPX07947.1 3-hydroxybutyrate dehydrogenase [Gordonia sp. i37]